MPMSSEAKAGFFFVIAFIILAMATFRVEELGQLFHPTYSLRVRFRHAAGLKMGDPVAVAGVRVGKIKDLHLESNHIMILAEIKGRVRVREDALAVIAWQGLLGTKYLDISLGDPNKPYLPDGAEIRNTREAIDIGAVMEKVDLAVGQIREALGGDVRGKIGAILDNVATISEKIAKEQGTLGKLIGSDEMYKKLDSIADDIVSASKSLRKILSDNEADVKALIKNLSEAGPEIRDAFRKAKDLMAKVESGEGVLATLLNDKQAAEDLKATVRSVRDFAEKLEKGKGLAQRLVSDEQMADDARAAIAEFRKVGEDVRATVAQVQTFMKKANESEGTIQLLLTRRDLYDDARKLMSDARDTLRSVKEQVPVGTFTGLLISAF
jgi:phospholipid/cholesterol/gamma-HCH transport system substrate-binding protein